MTDHTRGITVRILDKEFQIACPMNQEAALLEAADLLTDKMLKIRKAGKVIGMERIAIMAALNLAHDLLQSKNTITDHETDTTSGTNEATTTPQATTSSMDTDLTDRLLNLHRKIDSALSDPNLLPSHGMLEKTVEEDYIV